MSVVILIDLGVFRIGGTLCFLPGGGGGVSYNKGYEILVYVEVPLFWKTTVFFKITFPTIVLSCITY